MVSGELLPATQPQVVRAAAISWPSDSKMVEETSVKFLVKVLEILGGWLYKWL